MAKYSPLIGNVQNWIYDLYLKGNKIESGRKNYSEVIGLLISYQVWKAKTSQTNKKTFISALASVFVPIKAIKNKEALSLQHYL